MEKDKAYETAVFMVANFGYRSDSLAEATFILDTHLDYMSTEKNDGKPQGEVHWALMMVILHKLIEQKDIWTAREKAPKSVFWVPYVIK